MLTIYKASAGSGKTYTLAYEYIKALLGVKLPDDGTYHLNTPKHASFTTEHNNRHRHILAITFTNKATEEMKRRIIKKLRALTFLPVPDASGKVKDADYAEELCATYGCTRKELAAVASKALKQLLYDYHYFNISTIDSFFQKVLRAFARELDRQGDYRVEINDYEAVRKSVENMLDDFNLGHDENTALSQWIYDFMVGQIDKGNKTNLFVRTSSLHTNIIKSIANICDEKFKPYETEMRKYLSKPERLKGLEQSLRGRLKQIKEETENSIKSVGSALNKDGIDFDQLSKNNLKSFLEGSKKLDLPIDSKAIGTIRKIAEGTSNPVTKSKFRGKDCHVEALRQLAGQIVAAHDATIDLTAIAGSLSMLGLIAHAWGYLDEFTKENNTVLLSSTPHLLECIIADDEAPFIYERLGTQLHNFLIDEFQDTSELQWKNLKPLISTSLSEKHDNLIIGDEKQSIYRFRNSDWRLLNSVVPNEDFPAPKSRVVGDDEGSNTNYRSAPEVVRFNNKFFSTLASQLGLQGYGNVVQAIASKNKEKPGYVKFRNTDTFKDMADEILRQHDEGGYPWKDIAILVSTNDVGSAVIDFLLEQYPQIPVLSEESLYLRKSPAVMFVVSVLRLLDNEAAAAAAEESGYRNLTAKDVQRMVSRYEFFVNNGEEPSRALTMAVSADDDPESAKLNPILQRIRQRRPSTLPGLVETVIDEAIASGLGDQVIYLVALQDFVEQFCEKGHPTLSSLLEEWDARKEKLSVALSNDQDAVRVITVHKAKGLEFRCVHIPVAEWPDKKGFRGQWYPCPEIPGISPELLPPALYITLAKNMGENSLFHKSVIDEERDVLTDRMNMLYVAYTRACNELIVYRTPASKSSLAFDATNQVLNVMAPGVPEPVFGEPTTYIPEAEDVDETEVRTEPVALADYKVCFHPEAEVITSLVDALELDRDITETEEDEEETQELGQADVYENEEARQRGLLIHDILARVHGSDDIPAAMDRTCALRNTKPSERAEVENILRRMMTHPDSRIATWFNPRQECRTEAAIYDPSKDRVYRTDRIVYHPDGSVDVIDYKFTSSTSEKHVRQVRNYMRLLRSIHNAEVRGFLWYAAMKHPRIEQVFD